MVDVAKKANTTVATVSRVVNDVGYVSDGLRQRVEKAIEELGYVPNANARTLKTNVSRTIGVVVGDVVNPYAIELANAVAGEIAAQGYTTFIGTATDDVTSELAVLDAFHRQRVGGLVVATLPTKTSDEAIARLAEHGMPIVLVGRSLPEAGVDSVTADFKKGGMMATRHLIELGHRRIAFVGAELDDADRVSRLDGYLSALAYAGIAVRAEYVAGEPRMTGSPRYATQGTGYYVTQKLLQLSSRPTAIFARNDHVALGVLQALRHECDRRDRSGASASGCRVPEDVSVVGFDNIPLTSHIMPGLSTVAQPTEGQGQLAAKFLLDRITAPDEHQKPRDVVLECTLIARGSTASPGGPLEPQARTPTKTP